MLADNQFSRPKILRDEVVQCEYVAGKYLPGKIWVNGPLDIKLKTGVSMSPIILYNSVNGIVIAEGRKKETGLGLTNTKDGNFGEWYSEVDDVFYCVFKLSM